MKQPPLYLEADEITAVIESLPHRWAGRVAGALARKFHGDRKRAATAHVGPAKYSAEIREKIIAAIGPNMLFDRQCVTKLMDKLSLAWEDYGLKRMPDVTTVQAAVREARRREAALREACNQRVPVTGFHSPAHPRRLSLSSTST